LTHTRTIVIPKARLLPLLLAASVIAALALAGCGESATSEEEDAAGDTAATEEATGEEETEVEETAEPAAGFELVVPAELQEGPIPVRFTNFGVDGGENVSIPMDWAGVPTEAESLAMVFVDRHPIANEWIHWMVVAIPPDSAGVVEGASGTAMPAGSIELGNTWGETGYGGPEPPPGSGDHDYELIVYALDVGTLDLPQQNAFDEFESAVADHVLAQASWTGTFGR
jgi:Raf kinase inhibitor-like YbhB/YbcL family protein